MKMEYTKEEQKTLDRLLSERNVLQNRVNSIQKEINKIKDTEKKRRLYDKQKEEIDFRNNVLKQYIDNYGIDDSIDQVSFFSAFLDVYFEFNFGSKTLKELMSRFEKIGISNIYVLYYFLYVKHSRDEKKIAKILNIKGAELTKLIFRPSFRIMRDILNVEKIKNEFNIILSHKDEYRNEICFIYK